MNSPDLLLQGIAAAKAGRRAQARELLLKAARTDPQNEVAWLWLSDLVIDLEDRIAALENALTINPNNLKARARLETLQRRLQAIQERETAECQAQLEQTLKALQDGRRQQARDMLLQLVQEHERNEQAWLLLSDLLSDTQDQIIALENALTINPDNAQARSKVAQLQRLQQNPLLLGVKYEEQGELNRAITAYLTASTRARSPAEREEAGRRLEAARNRLDSSGVKVVHPTLRVVRLAAGPPLLFGFLMLLQGGLNPLRLSLLFYLGGLVVSLGSFLISVTTARPRHPIWVTLFWKPGGAGESTARFTLGLAGWLLLLAPYLLFFLRTIERMDALRARFP